MTSEIMIKGMVCNRCVSAISEGIRSLGYEVNDVKLGKVSLNATPDQDGFSRIERFLIENGFNLISNRHLRMVNQIKEIINDAFAKTGKYDSKLKFPVLLSETLNMNYASISELFTKVEGVTLEKYIISKRLEKVKELLVYTSTSLTEIAYMTGFSNINHLSNQFKALTGFPPTHFRSVKSSKQKLSIQSGKADL